MRSEFDLNKFRTEFLQSEGWGVSDCYKSYDDKFLRRDAQDAYEGAKWAWNHQKSKVDELQNNINLLNEALDIKEQLNQRLREREDDLQKQVDAVKTLIEEYKDPPTEDKTFRHALSVVAYELEQALKESKE